MTRLNKVVGLLEDGLPAFGPLVASAGSYQEANALADSPYDMVTFDLEHNPYDVDALRISLQFLLNRRQIHRAETVAPSIVPFVRVPVNGRERNEWIVKQVLDLGVFGVIFPMVNTVEEAEHAIASCRYPRPQSRTSTEPSGLRGHAPTHAVRYWGLTPDEYYEKADVWPQNPDGEILPILQCEHVEGVSNIRRILSVASSRPGVVLIGENDLSVSMGYGGKSTPEVESAVGEVIRACHEFGVPYGTARGNATSIEQKVADGYRFIFTRELPSYEVLRAGLRAAGRS
ncbi:HpcH/HpaI aldolase family protein [Microbacterium sp. A82]|uniref:HpcH/HpaI aldolase family protein n=1 Tax=unclassified Microbacterium TaxID=2609290 RepID=UPI003F41523F